MVGFKSDKSQLAYAAMSRIDDLLSLLKVLLQ